MQSDLNCLRQNAKDYLWGTSRLSDSLNQPLLLAYCSLIFVTQGHADLSIQFKNYHLQAGDFLVLAEDSLTIIKNQSADFSCNYCIFNRHFAAEVAAVLPNALFAYLNQMPHFSPNTEQAGLIKIWQSQTDFMIKSTEQYQRTLLCNHLQNFFLVLSEIVNHKKNLPKNEYTRKERLCWKFWEMIAIHCHAEREVLFYAQALNISPYYLSQLCKQFFNDSPKTLIDRLVIVNLKQRLKMNTLSIQVIADQMHFNDASYMCRYFKKHTGYTLRQYRKDN
ncbi:helix-turn-helix domain-containing protein [Acinetobacter guillouiae]|uniref:helix-turn-helix domain-containing protein n=1 Tax=Acinetobacter guillouiae TaxID=106649 RepID=UPI002E1ACD8D